MKRLSPLLFYLLAATSTIASDAVSSAVVSNRTDRGFAVTASIRTNACTLELWRYTKGRPEMQGYWTQSAYVGDKQFMKIQHWPSQKEQSLAVDHDTGYAVLQLDRDLDGKYEMFNVISIKDQTVIDVFIVTTEGWLRHGTAEELRERKELVSRNKKGMEQVDKQVKDLLQGANKALNKQ